MLGWVFNSKFHLVLFFVLELSQDNDKVLLTQSYLPIKFYFPLLTRTTSASPFSILQSVAKIGNASTFSQRPQHFVGPPAGRALRGRGPRRRPSRWTRDCVISAELPCAPGRFSQSRSRERQQPFAAQCKQVPKSPPFCTAPFWGPSNACPSASRPRIPPARG